MKGIYIEEVNHNKCESVSTVNSQHEMCVFLIQSSVKLGKILYIPQCVAKIYKEKKPKRPTLGVYLPLHYCKRISDGTCSLFIYHRSVVLLYGPVFVFSSFLCKSQKHSVGGLVGVRRKFFSCLSKCTVILGSRLNGPAVRNIL